MAGVLQDENFTKRMTALDELEVQEEEPLDIKRKLDLNAENLTAARVEKPPAARAKTPTIASKSKESPVARVDDPVVSTLATKSITNTTQSTSNALKPVQTTTKKRSGGNKGFLDEGDEVYKNDDAGTAPNRCDVDPIKAMQFNQALVRSIWSHPDNRSIRFVVVQATLSCSECVRRELNPNGCMPILYPEDDFYDYMHTAWSLWMQRDFLESFAGLVNHYAHTHSGDRKNNILVVPCGRHHTGSVDPLDPTPGIGEIDNISIIKFFVYQGSHYAVLTFSLSNHVVAVQDGYFPRVSVWLADIEHIVDTMLPQGYRLPIRLTKDHRSTVQVDHICKVSNPQTSWLAVLGEALPQGDNGTECGYLAGYNLAESVIGDITPEINCSNVYAARMTVINLYKYLLETFLESKQGVSVQVRSKAEVDYLDPKSEALNTAQGKNVNSTNGCIVISSIIAVKYIAYKLDIGTLVPEVDIIIDSASTAEMISKARKIDGVKGVEFTVGSGK